MSMNVDVQQGIVILVVALAALYLARRWLPVRWRSLVGGRRSAVSASGSGCGSCGDCGGCAQPRHPDNGG
jgi:hypothetical protein